MYLRDYLHDIPLKALRAIGETLGVEVPYSARIKLMNAIDNAFWHEGFVTELVSGLDIGAQRLVVMLAFCFDSGVDTKSLTRRYDELSRGESGDIEQPMTRLVSLALAGLLHEEDGMSYFCPSDVAERIRIHAFESIMKLPPPSETSPASSAPNILEDVIALLAEAYRAPLPLTLTGQIRKLTLDRVFNGSLVSQDHSCPFADDERASFVTGYLVARGLIHFNRKTAATTPKLGGWLRMTMHQRYQDIVAYTLRTFFGSRYNTLAVYAVIREIQPGTVIPLDRLAAFLGRWTMMSGGEDWIAEHLDLFLTVLYHLGLLSMSPAGFVMTTTGHRFFRGETVPGENTVTDRFMVQPNFEIIAGPELDPQIRFRLELLTDRVSRDMVVTCRISRDSITRARERGWATADIISFLEESSMTELPQNVRFSIDKWATDYGSIYFEDVLLLRFRDSAAADQVVHIPEIAPFIKEKLSDNVFVVLRDHAQRIAAILKEKGFQPEVFGAPPADALRSPEAFEPDSTLHIITETRLPVSHHDFVFPVSLMNNENTS